MPEQVTVRVEDQIIEVRSAGDVSAEQMKASLAEVVRLRNEQGIKRVLIDATDQTSLPPTMSIYEFAGQLSKLCRDIKFAVVGVSKLHNDITFMETVARNRGAYVRVFADSESALEWLAEE